MFKRVILAAALSLALSVSAFAADNGFYAGLKFLDSIQSTGSISKNGGVEDMFDIDNYTQNTVGGGIFVGFDFYPQFQVPVRTEIEYAIRTNSTTTWDLKGEVGSALKQRGGSGSASVKGEWNLQTLFLNAYWDFHNDTNFTPYIGAGVGLGFLRTKYELEVNDFSLPAAGVDTPISGNASVNEMPPCSLERRAGLLLRLQRQLLRRPGLPLCGPELQ
jgi:opacity protein-like surface antigen